MGDQAPGTGAAAAAGLNPAQMSVINSGSWAAAIFTWIYLIAMRAYTHALIAFLLSLILLVNLAVWIYYILHGKRLAWANRTWQGFDNFLACQRIWDKWAKWFFFLGLPLLFVVSLVVGFLWGELFLRQP